MCEPRFPSLCPQTEAVETIAEWEGTAAGVAAGMDRMVTRDLAYTMGSTSEVPQMIHRHSLRPTRRPEWAGWAGASAATVVVGAATVVTAEVVTMENAGLAVMATRAVSSLKMPRHPRA